MSSIPGTGCSYNQGNYKEYGALSPQQEQLTSSVSAIEAESAKLMEGLGTEKEPGKIQVATTKLQNLQRSMQMISDMLKSLHEMTMSVVRNMKFS